MIRSIDDDDDRVDRESPNYDETDDEVEEESDGATKPSKSAHIDPETSDMLPLENNDDDDINMASEELEEVLGDGPIQKKGALNGAQTLLKDGAVGTEANEEEEGEFELGSWV